MSDGAADSTDSGRGSGGPPNPRAGTATGKDRSMELQKEMLAEH